MQKEPDSVILVQGMSHGGVSVISNNEAIITEVISSLPDGSSSLEITIKDVTNLQSVRPLSAMFNIELKDSEGALIAEGSSELIELEVLTPVSIEDVTVTRKSQELGRPTDIEIRFKLETLDIMPNSELIL